MLQWEHTKSVLGWAKPQWDDFSVSTFIPIKQQHPSNDATQMPELKTQVLSGLVLIAANWCINTSRHMWCVCVIHGEQRGLSSVSVVGHKLSALFSCTKEHSDANTLI